MRILLTLPSSCAPRVAPLELWVVPELFLPPIGLCSSPQQSCRLGGSSHCYPGIRQPERQTNAQTLTWWQLDFQNRIGGKFKCHIGVSHWFDFIRTWLISVTQRPIRKGQNCFHLWKKSFSNAPCFLLSGTYAGRMELSSMPLNRLPVRSVLQEGCYQGDHWWLGRVGSHCKLWSTSLWAPVQTFLTGSHQSCPGWPRLLHSLPLCFASRKGQGWVVFPKQNTVPFNSQSWPPKSRKLGSANFFLLWKLSTRPAKSWGEQCEETIPCRVHAAGVPAVNPNLYVLAGKNHDFH